MKKLLCMVLTICMLVMTGCNDTPTPENTNDLIIVLNNSSNRYLADLSLIYDDIEKACADATNITVIVDDGKPFISASFSIPAINTKKSEANQKRDIQKYTSKVLDVCKNAMAETGEINTYSALSLAERSVNTAHNTKIVLLDSLLPTTGKIDFSEKPLYLTNIEETVQSFSDSLSNLSYTEINIYGIGEVSGKQPQLSNDDYNKLLTFWNEFFDEIGCCNVNISKKPYTVKEEVPDSLPDVSVCIVSQDTNEIAVNSVEDKISETTEEIQDNTVIEFDSEMISFSPNTADIINKDEAIHKISNIAEKINNTEQPVVLVGMTATYGDVESSEVLSLKRSEAVKSLFVDDLGVTADKIICIGTGYNDNKLHVNDLNADGSLNETKAQQNRKVVAMTETTAKESSII